MARYPGPKSGVSRRLGANSWGTAGENRALERRPYPPGEHGRSRRRNASEYLEQLQEKQKARFTYGLNERQFRNLYEEASRKRGVTGEIMLQLLERRLDNLGYPVRWGGARPPRAPPVREPRARRGQRPPGRHPQLPRPQGRRRQPAGQGPRDDP